MRVNAPAPFFFSPKFLHFNHPKRKATFSFTTFFFFQSSTTIIEKDIAALKCTDPACSFSFFPCEKQGVPDFSEFGDVYELGFGLGHDQPPTTAIVKKEFQRKLIYHMSPLEVIPFYTLSLKPIK